MSKLIANSFQMPNAIFDDTEFVNLSDAAFRCYAFIVRKTRGWNKSHDKISLSQFMAMRKTGKRATQNALDELVKSGLIVCTKKQGFPNEYSLNDTRAENCTSAENCAGTPCRKLHGSGAENCTGVVQKIAPTKDTNKRHYQKDIVETLKIEPVIQTNKPFLSTSRPDVDLISTQTKKQNNKKIIEQVAKVYNESNTPFARVLKSNAKRDSLVNARIKDILNFGKQGKTKLFGHCKTDSQAVDALGRFFTMAGCSEFLTGNNDKGWMADFDYLMSDQGFTKTLEGKWHTTDAERQNAQLAIMGELEDVA